MPHICISPHVNAPGQALGAPKLYNIRVTLIRRARVPVPREMQQDGLGPAGMETVLIWVASSRLWAQ